ncbi:hypothetical protein LCGC14_0626040 [marine sediment metagenome]|uniref:Uncharacterized protein n=1 Tax=marine sediment metagenome TaxID=412755 RepID=A0A0F9R8D9_9ZZZZ
MQLFPMTFWSSIRGIARSDGTQMGIRSSALIGAPTAANEGTFAFWAKLSATVAFTFNIDAPIGEFFLNIEDSVFGRGRIQMAQADGATTIDSVTNVGAYVPFLNTWSWFGWSWNYTASRLAIYANDTNILAPGRTTFGPGTSITYASGAVGIWGDTPAGTPRPGTTGCLARAYFSDVEYDFNVEANRRFFINAGGGPVTVPTGGLIDLPDGHPDDNRGTGGDFIILNGPFLTCADAP